MLQPTDDPRITATTPLLINNEFRTSYNDETVTSSRNSFTPPEMLSDEQKMASYGPIKRFLIKLMTLEGFRTVRLSLQSVGVIYGDIGTSPLYVFSTIFNGHNSPTEVEIYGAVSLIFWSLCLIFILKYVTIVLFADDNGEGGTFALYSLICRYCNIVPRGTQHDSDLALTHYDTDDFTYFTPNDAYVPWQNKVKKLISKSSLFRSGLLLVVLFGTSLVMGDGILTPAVSVLSAVEGVQIAFPQMGSYIVPITVVIILFLFLGQRLGTSKVSKFFAPVIIVWLLSIASIGAYNISFNPKILNAISPYYALKYFEVRGYQGWESLGGILLCISGVEALFADLGHFNRISIRLSATSIVFPCLLLTYFGQAAQISLNPSVVSNAFWLTVPTQVFWPMLIIATCAAVVASQAMVSAAFSIIHQAMALACFPKVNIVHTSRKIHGQVFVPEVSAILMILSISLVIIFQESTSLTAAYGLASCMLMFLTTCLISLVMIVVWKLNFILVFSFFLIFFSIDLAFLSSTLLKLMSGGWIPLAFAFFFSIIMNVWRWGTDLKHRAIVDSQVSLDSLLYDPVPSSTPTHLPSTDDILKCAPNNSWSNGWLLKTSNEPQPVARVPGLALFYSEAETNVPAVFKHTLNCFSAVPEVVVFVTIRHIVVPTVLPHERFLLTRLSIRGFYRCVARYGYMDVIERGDEFVSLLTDQLTGNIQESLIKLKRKEEEINKIVENNFNPEDISNKKDVNPRISLNYPSGLEVQFSNLSKKSPTQQRILSLEMEMDILESALRHGATFVLGKNLVKAKEKSPVLHKLGLNYIYSFLSNNDRSFSLKTTPSKTIQVGIPLRV
ncbi:potassium transporter [Neoconidiobolus thromboides FSU 785]|nr:potassium transporter [Neoconidiobolus thromboides FSU 785]